MLALKIVFILFVSVCSCTDKLCIGSTGSSNAPDIYEEAKMIDIAKRERNEILYARHNVTPDDFMYNFHIESFNLTVSNRKADILLEFQRLLKDSGQCKRKTFKDCLRASNKCVSDVDRCLLPSGICDPSERYSRINAFCNNLEKPNTGNPRVPYHRMLDAAYQDGISKIRRASNGKEFPNARVIGNLFDKTKDFKSSGHTLATVHLMLSQLFAHDTSRRGVHVMRGNNANGISCCKANYSGPLPRNETNSYCVPVPYPKDDAFYAEKGIFCQSFIRMQPTLDPNCKIKSVAQENTVSSFLDLNNIYGDSLADLAGLRTFSGGLFKMNRQNHLPFNDAGALIAGDFRFGQNTGLTTMHVIFYRFHNNMANYLGEQHRDWSDDDIFFEARRIVIAVYQHIIYFEWLPLVLGEELIHKFKLNCQGKCEKYNPKIVPTTTMEYGIAFRWFHMNIPRTLWLVDGDGEVINEFPFSDTYLSFDLTNKNFTDFVRGLMKKPQRIKRVGYTDEYRNLFFKTNYCGHVVGIDGLMLDIMRERDGGVAPYIDFYPMCLDKKIELWEDLEPYFEKPHFKLLRRLYKKTRDIEFMVGILLERRRDGGNIMGKIGGCVTAKQFYHYKYGDRFFYSHRNNPHRFSKDQLRAIQEMTFAKLVCMNTDVGIVPERSLISVSPKNKYVNCDTLGPFDLEPFKNNI